MKVLFILHKSVLSNIFKQKTAFQLITILKNKNIELGLLTNIQLPIQNNFLHNIKINNDIFHREWDIIILQDQLDMLAFENIQFKSKVYKLILITDQIENQIFQISLLKRVFIFTPIKNDYHSLSPYSNFMKLLPWSDLEIVLKRYHQKETINILYYIEENSNLKNTIEFLNFLSHEPDYTLFIVCCEWLKIALMPNLSANMKLLELKEISDNKYSVALVSGKLATSSILNCIPTIILGNYGFGSLITPYNIQSHYTNQFKGRIGGYFNEEIPVEIVLLTIKNALFNHIKINILLQENKTILQNILNNNMCETFFELLKTVYEEK